MTSPNAGSAISSSDFAQARSAAATSRLRSCVSQVKPSPIVCHDDLVAERRKRIAFRRVPGALDELHDADPMAAPEHAQRKPERGGRFALAGAGVDDQKTFLDRLLRDLGILHGLALCHLGAMAFGLGIIDGLGHGCPFTVERQPGDHEDHAVGARGETLVEAALQVAKAPGQRVVGHDAETDFVGHQHHRARARRSSASSKRPISASTSTSASMRLLSQSVRQSTRTGAPAGALSSASARSSGASIVCQPAPRRAR